MSRFATPRARSTILAPRRKKILRSNFEPQHDALLSTVTNNTTGSTLQDWKAATSPAVLKSKASEAAYKGWKRRRSNESATPVSASLVMQSPPPPVQRIQLPPPFSSMSGLSPQATGPVYMPMPASFGAHWLARGAAQPVGQHASQNVEEDTRQAVKRHCEAHAAPEYLLKGPRQAKAEQGIGAVKELPEERAPESEAEKDDDMLKKEVDM
ncbi:hypothetical protein DOTSEDRAFT_28488 [Dothistroma septosporum NZE10]|uniref:Uncharacterized protein n=1 Tax=Dothistroma septosporum (strain NZE10 / CBS 128990) TaxID=675120 RepID=M2XIQ0_DOTSN|nr:hypothetical protein DOTSEDRAFT_28488 [Dothistroma septosporum NZE10]